jgi:cobalamin biosynthesis Mg chelatase CobN
MPNSESPGLATDARGNPVIDPTKNVLDLVGSAIDRQDDLRQMESEHAKDLRKINSAHEKEIRKLSKELSDTQLESLAAQVDTKDKARQEAISKAEKAATEAATALATEFRQSTEGVLTRLGALERGGAGVASEKVGTTEYAIAEQARRAAQTAKQAVYVAAAVGLISLIALIVVLVKPGG